MIQSRIKFRLVASLASLRRISCPKQQSEKINSIRYKNKRSQSYRLYDKDVISKINLSFDDNK